MVTSHSPKRAQEHQGTAGEMCTASFHPASSTSVPQETLKVPSRQSCTSQNKTEQGWFRVRNTL